MEALSLQHLQSQNQSQLGFAVRLDETESIRWGVRQYQPAPKIPPICCKKKSLRIQKIWLEGRKIWLFLHVLADFAFYENAITLLFS